jgi:hypothetical protein
MYSGSMDGWSSQTFASSYINRYLRPPDSCEYTPSILCCVINGGISMDCADAQQLYRRMIGSE